MYERNALLRAMDDIEDHTCVTFEHLDSSSIDDPLHYVVFYESQER